MIGSLRLCVISAFSNYRLRLIVSLLLGYRDVLQCQLCNTVLKAHFKILAFSMLLLTLTDSSFVGGNRKQALKCFVLKKFFKSKSMEQISS